MTSRQATREGMVSERNTAWGSLLNGVGSVVSTGLGFLLVIVITRSYGAENTGVLFGAIALFAIVGTAAKLGTETALVFYIARDRSTGSAASTREALLAAIVPVTVVSVAGALALHVLAEPIGDLFSDDRSDDFAHVLRTLAPFLPAWSIGLVLLGATRGAGTMVPTAVGLQLVQPTLQIIFVLIATSRDWGLAAIARCWALPLAATALIAAAGLVPIVRASAETAKTAETAPTTPDRTQVWRELWAFAGPRGVAGTLQVSLDRVAILLIGALSTSVAAGQWAAISRLIGVAQRSFHAVGQALNPRVSALAQRADWKAIARVFEQITVATVAALTPAVLALVIFPKAALEIFGGDEFAVASRPLVIAALVTLGATAFAHVDNILLMAGRSTVALINTTAALATTILLDLALVPPFGLEGAAFAMAAGVLVYRGAAAVQVQRWFGVDSLTRPVVLVALIAAALTGGIMLAGRIIGGDTLVAAIIAGTVSVLLYATLLLKNGRRLGVDLRFDAI